MLSKHKREKNIQQKERKKIRKKYINNKSKSYVIDNILYLSNEYIFKMVYCYFHYANEFIWDLFMFCGSKKKKRAGIASS